jgi:tRNA pseudouridine55 synthase
VKVAGPTSHDVVDRARRAMGSRRIGHLGTLDPFAEGVLVLVLGHATRLARFAAGWTKTYEGVVRLGRTTATDDPTGETLETSEGWRGLAEAEIGRVVASFRGGYDQRPPVFSALKVDGERAYRRARRGERVAPAPRRVEVLDVEVLACELPDVRLRAVVRGGVYLRSLARDLGAALGCGAHLAALRRTTVGPFSLGDAVPPEALTPADVRDAAVLVHDLPRRELDAAERAAVIHGRPIPVCNVQRATGNAALFWEGRLVAVAEVVNDVLKPRVVVVNA